MTGPRAIISNGTGLFPLGWLAAEVAGRERLHTLLTAGYPKRLAGTLPSLFPSSPGLARLEGRRVAIDDGLVRCFWTSEIQYQAAARLRGRRGLAGLHDRVDEASFRSYARAAARYIASLRAPPRLYHYRAGFGLDSVPVARRWGMIAVCHHTSAHPLTYAPLNRNRGRRPTPEQIEQERATLRGPQALILEDIEQADFVIAESDFEVETFRWCGHPAAAVRALYPGIDPTFRSHVPERPARSPGPPRLLFAGSLTERKGVEVLQNALAAAPDLDVTLDLAGTLTPEGAERFRGLLADPRVRYLGVLPRPVLAQRMSEADIFVLPTFSEGSVRVVFEALACGCFVITTPNSGTVARDGVNGRIVPPGDAQALLAAIQDSIARPGDWPEISRRNRSLALEQYTPARFVQSVLDLYDELAGAAAAPGAAGQAA